MSENPKANSNQAPTPPTPAQIDAHLRANLIIVLYIAAMDVPGEYMPAHKLREVTEDFASCDELPIRFEDELHFRSILLSMLDWGWLETSEGRTGTIAFDRLAVRMIGGFVKTLGILVQVANTRAGKGEHS
jgi:hypothetical protein